MGEALLVGALLSGVAGLKSSHDQRKAARAAARAAEAAANKPATVSTSTAAAATTNTEGNAEQAVQQKAQVARAFMMKPMMPVVLMVTNSMAATRMEMIAAAMGP